MFTLAISCLTTSNLPWFMDVTFQVPIQYFSLQNWTMFPSPVTSTAGCCFCFGSVSSFFLEFFLHWSPVAFWAPIDLGSSSYSVLSFCLFMLFMGFSRQEYWSGLPFSSPMNHNLQTSPPWAIQPGWPKKHSMAWFHLVIQAVVRVIRLVICLRLCFQSVCPLMPSLSAYTLTWVSLRSWRRGTTPCPRSGAAAALCWGSHEKIPPRPR